jgi:uncharacterized membrane protein
MGRKAAITVHRSREEVQQRWSSSPHAEQVNGTVTYKDAPGDRGTEIYVEVEKSGPGGVLGEVVEKVAGMTPLAKAKDHLRRFKQKVETGEVSRSDGTPEGESVERKLKQRPAQPLADAELAEVGGR